MQRQTPDGIIDPNTGELDDWRMSFASAGFSLDGFVQAIGRRRREQRSRRGRWTWGKDYEGADYRDPYGRSGPPVNDGYAVKAQGSISINAILMDSTAYGRMHNG